MNENKIRFSGWEKAMLSLAIALHLASCDAAAGDARERYEFLRENGASKGEVCDAARKVQEAYADARNSARYQDARNQAELDCMLADSAGRDLPYRDAPTPEGDAAAIKAADAELSRMERAAVEGNAVIAAADAELEAASAAVGNAEAAVANAAE